VVARRVLILPVTSSALRIGVRVASILVITRGQAVLRRCTRTCRSLLSIQIVVNDLIRGMVVGERAILAVIVLTVIFFDGG